VCSPCRSACPAVAHRRTFTSRGPRRPGSGHRELRAGRRGAVLRRSVARRSRLRDHCGAEHQSQLRRWRFREPEQMRGAPAV
jgi:hypothetical protein